MRSICVVVLNEVRDRSIFILFPFLTLYPLILLSDCPIKNNIYLYISHMGRKQETKIKKNEDLNYEKDIYKHHIKGQSCC